MVCLPESETEQELRKCLKKRRSSSERGLLHDGQVLDIDGIKIECFLVPGHTWGHMVYLIDDKYQDMRFVKVFRSAAYRRHRDQ